MNYIVSILVIVFCTLPTNIVCAQAPMVLKIKMMKSELIIPFTPQTPIALIKEAIHQEEGIPTGQLILTTSAGWALGFPPRRLYIELANSQTCNQYDLQNNQEIHLSLRMLKTRAQIDAELKARKEALTRALLGYPLVLLSLIAEYDTHNQD